MCLSALLVLMSSINCSSSYTASSSYYLTVVPSFQSRASPASLPVLLAMYFLGGGVRLYQTDQSLGPLNHVFLLVAQRIKGPVILFCVMLLIRIGNVLVALMYFFGQLLEMFIGRGGLLFVLSFLLCAPCVLFSCCDHRGRASRGS
jgi:hypothetical protein